MKRYTVTQYYEGSISFDVLADSEEQAIALFEQKASEEISDSDVFFALDTKSYAECQEE